MAFTARWHLRHGPTAGYRVASCVLRRESSRNPEAERGQEATVISGEEWSGLASDFFEALAPARPLQGVYYQAFLADGVVYRDTNSAARLAAFGEHPEEVEVTRQFSLEETLELCAKHLGEKLLRLHPGKSLFVLMASNPRRFTSPVLLDMKRNVCIWFIPAALQDATENTPALGLTVETFSAMIPESHGLALLKNPLSSVFRLADLGVVTVGRWLPLRLPKLASSVPALSHAPAMDMEKWDGWLDEYTGTVRQAGSLELLIDGEEFFSRLDEAFKNATNYIDAQMFIFDRDDVAVKIADQLKEKAKDIRVRVLHDRLGTISGGLSPPATPLPVGFAAPSSMHSYLKQESRVKVRATLNPWLTHDHSKVVVVDGAYAWLGGMNFGREYRYEWHDAMVELRGPVTARLEREFRRSWAHAGLLGDLAYAVSLLATSTASNVPPDSKSSGLRLLPTRTAWKPFAAALHGVLRQAQSYVYAQNPYLFDKRTILGLANARQRGVDVRVILPRVNDFKPGERASLVVANYLLASGIRVYFYPGMTHTKALLADGWACLGSANMNHLSLRVNHEQNVASADPQFVEDVRRRLFEADFARSIELSEPVSVDWMDVITNLLLEGP